MALLLTSMATALAAAAPAAAQELVNHPPVADDQMLFMDEDTTLSGQMTATDPDGDPLTYTVTGSSHVSGSYNPSNGTFTLNPTPAGYNGPASISFSVDDGHGGSDTGEISITVRAPNHPPTAADANLTTTEDTPVTFTPAVADADGDPLTLSASAPAHGTATCSATTCTYTPNPDFNGTDAFDYTVTDSHGASSTGHVAVTVNPVNDPPTAANANLTTAEDTPVTFTPAVADADGDPLTLSASAPAHGTATCGATTCTYTPAPDYYGSDQFTYTTRDGKGGEATATVRVTVTEVSSPTVLDADDVVAIVQGLRITLPFRARLTEGPSGAPLPGRTITFSWRGTPVCSAKTDASGVATCNGGLTGLIGTVVNFGYTATFAGDPDHRPSSDTALVLRASVRLL